MGGAPPIAPPAPVAPPLIPISQSGVSEDFLRGREQVGSGPAAQWYGEDLSTYGAQPFHDAMVPPDYLDWLNSVKQYAPPTLATYETYPGGRPTPTRLGVDQSMGGLARPEDRTFLSSDQLVRQTLATLPPVFAQFANRHIGRYTVTDAYGDPTNQGGYYMPQDPTSLARVGNVLLAPQPVQGPINVGRGETDRQIYVARHELLHALSREDPAFAKDDEAGFPALMDAVRASVPQLQAPVYDQLRRQIGESGSKGDWPHVFTAIAEASLSGLPLPPVLQQYFAPMYRPAPQPTPTMPPLSIPPAPSRPRG